MMVAIRLSAVVDQDGELRVKVPDNIAPGPVELVIQSPQTPLPPLTNPANVKIRDTIMDLLCIKQHKDPIALTWIVDEVTVWSMD
jgi:hypothetical protein